MSLSSTVSPSRFSSSRSPFRSGDDQTPRPYRRTLAALQRGDADLALITRPAPATPTLRAVGLGRAAHPTSSITSVSSGSLRQLSRSWRRDGADWAALPARVWC
ncbi:MAG: hypothetical protein RMM58_02750 [Chloroflexota bacterium]|nr:hypothetical protein [Dehalococcoidia bacterium]MDW8252776.1 hypothetical protein [Chloroflexota bacterium]